MPFKHNAAHRHRITRLWLVAQLHRLSAKLHQATGAPAAHEVLELRATDTLAEANAVRIAAE